MTAEPCVTGDGCSGGPYPNTILPSSGSGTGKATSELRTPDDAGGYAGIYANWNVDVTGDGTADDPWDFGTGGQYPALSIDFNSDSEPASEQ